jgi:hypothetical protein
MKTTISLSVLALAIAVGGAFAKTGDTAAEKKTEPAKAEMKAAKKSKCDDCPMHKKEAAGKAEAKKCGGMTCPEKLPGVTTVSKPVAAGVEVTMTAKNPETVAQMQELSVVHYSPKAEKCPGCPTTIPGAETKVENTADGVKVLITGKTPEVIKQIQEASAREHMGHGAAVKEEVKKEAKAKTKYTCAMKCVISEKPGKCPKCGMPMEAVK